MSDHAAGTRFTVTLRFHGDLPFFLKRRHPDERVVRTLGEKTSVKDAIEACGVPHTEVDLILCNGAAINFTAQLTRDASVDVYSVATTSDFHPAARLQRRHMVRFVVDGHLGKLARDLRLLGFDTVYQCDADDAWLVLVATEQNRALLTRDRRLLMHAVISDGYCPRTHIAEAQLVETVRRFDLLSAVQPYARCLRCNGLLEGVAKESIVEQLEPLTKIYYTDFRRCVDCGRIYWSGSHSDKLDGRIERVRTRLREDAEARSSEMNGPDWARTSDPALIKRML